MMIVMGVYAFLSLQNLNGKTPEITSNWLPGILISNEMGDAATEYRIAVFRHRASPPEVKANYEKVMNAANAKMQGAIAAYQKSVDAAVYASAADKQKDMDAIAKIRANWDAAFRLHEQFVPLSRAGDEAGMRTIMKTQIEPQLDALENDVLKPMIAFNKEGATRLTAESADQYGRSS